MRNGTLNLKIKIPNIKIAFFMLVILIYSGSLLYMTSNLWLQLLIIPFALYVILLFNKQSLWSTFVKLDDKYCIVFLYILFISIITNLILISKITQFALYFFYELLIFFIGYFIVRIIEYDKFKKYFIDIITVLAFISIILWLSPSLVKKISFINHIHQDWRFASILIYNMNLVVPMRNCGPFWEPGLYQAYLNLALLFIVMDNNVKRSTVRVIILMIALITTFSSTGYLLFIIVILLKIYTNPSLVKRIVLSIVVLIIGLYIVLNIDKIFSSINRYTLYSISDKFYSSDNASVMTRLYSGLCDIHVAMRNPFGANRADLEYLRSHYSVRYGNITASTNTFTSMLTYFGWCIGIGYIWLWIRGCFRQQNGIVNKILLLIFFSIILQTELHVDLLLFNILLFYWNSYYT